jgi:hypothetical protein
VRVATVVATEAWPSVEFAGLVVLSTESSLVAYVAIGPAGGAWAPR